jgi:3-hydroxybutyryl-CoA dehydrogenase
MRIERIAVVGAGIMGRGIAYVSAVAGYDTALYDVNADALERAQREIEGIVTKGIEAGKVDRAVAGKMRMSTHTDLEAAARRADLVIEAAPEDMRLKIELFERLERMCGPDTIFATNTSALSVTEMAASTKRAPQVCGMHFEPGDAGRM